MAKGIGTASPNSKLDEVMKRHFGKIATRQADDGCQVGGGGGAYSIRMIPFYLSKSHDTIVVAIRHQRPGDLDVWNFKPEYVVKALAIYKDEFMTKTKDVFKIKIGTTNRFLLRNKPHGENKIRQTFSVRFNRNFQMGFLTVFLEKHPFDNSFPSSVKEFGSCLRGVLRSKEFRALYRAVVEDSATPKMANSLDTDSDLWKGLKKSEVVIQNEKKLDAMFMDDDIEELLQALWNVEEISKNSPKKILRSGWKGGKYPEHLKHEEPNHKASESASVTYGSDSDDNNKNS